MTSKRLNLFQSFLVTIPVACHIFLISPLYILIENYSEFRTSSFEIIIKSLIAITLIVLPFLFIGTYILIRKKIYILLSLLISFAIYLYIQFYFFAWHYGIFDGREILWSEKSTVNFYELPTIIILIFLSFTLQKKFYSNALVVLVALFLGESFITTTKYVQLLPALKTTGKTIRKMESSTSIQPRIIDFFTANEKELSQSNILSKEKNIIVILVDTLQSDFFEKIIEDNPSIKKKMQGFVFFRNSAGFFPYTTLTIPAILTGQSYKPGDKIEDYIKNISRNRIDNILKSKGFSISSIPLNSRIEYLNSNSQTNYEIASIFDIVLFRHAPHLLKPIVFNKHKFLLRPFFLKTVPTSNPEIDLAVFESLFSNSFLKNDKGHFKFIHLWGMHPPSMLDKNCQIIEASHKRVDVENQAYCIVMQIVAYLERLKELEVFDNSVILLIADTGSKYPVRHQNKVLIKSAVPEFVISSAHPVIIGKDFNQRGELRISDAPVSLIDIAKTILSRLEVNSKKIEGFDLFSIKENQERTRSFFYYKGSEEARLESIPQMQEFIINGFIRDRNSWKIGKLYSSDKFGDDIMSLIDFGDQKSSKFQDLGWSVEALGRKSSWTIAYKASLIGKLPQKESIRMVARLSNPHSDQKVEIRLNGRNITTWNIDKPSGFREYSAAIKLSDTDRNNISKVEFITEKIDVASDKDFRKLGICVDWVRFE